MLEASSEIRVMLPVCSSQYNGFVPAYFPFRLKALYPAALRFDFRKSIPPVDLTCGTCDFRHSSGRFQPGPCVFLIGGKVFCPLDDQAKDQSFLSGENTYFFIFSKKDDGWFSAVGDQKHLLFGSPCEGPQKHRLSTTGCRGNIEVQGFTQYPLSEGKDIASIHPYQIYFDYSSKSAPSEASCYIYVYSVPCLS